MELYLSSVPFLHHATISFRYASIHAAFHLTKVKDNLASRLKELWIAENGNLTAITRVVTRMNEFRPELSASNHQIHGDACIDCRVKGVARSPEGLAGEIV